MRPSRSLLRLAAAVLPPFVPGMAAAEASDWITGLDLSGSIAAEVRVFPSGPAYPAQDDAVISPSVALEPEAVYEWNGGDDRITLKPFLRLDAHDDNRTHVDLREGNWLHLGDGYDLVVGVDKVFWGVAESRHLVDIVNQTDLVEDVDGEDKLGQPMVQLAVPTDGWGTFTAFVLPGFRERTFPDDGARLRGPLPIADDSSYDSGTEALHADVALRWTRVLGDFDVGLAHFHGTSREPRFVARTVNGRTELVPHYDLIDQSSLDLQYTTDAWLWKLEVIGRGGHGDYFLAAVAGFEYTLYQLNESDHDLGLLVELLYDGRDDDGRAPATPFDRDIFLGTRYTLNDEDDTSFLAGAVVDPRLGSTLLSFEAERRIGDDWKAEIEARIFAGVDGSDPLAGIREDDHVTFRLTRYF